jgi:uncharacterized protein YndB with AHSA1/START domain
MTELLIRQTIEVAASAETLWRVLTDSQFIRQYMFGCNAETDWKPGSPLLWRGAADGKLYVKGAVVSFNPPLRLSYTVIDATSSMPDIPSNYLTMTYSLTRLGTASSRLEITQGDYATVANGQQRYQDTLAGDDHILAAIKNIAEAQQKSQ